MKGPELWRGKLDWRHGHLGMERAELCDRSQQTSVETSCDGVSLSCLPHQTNQAQTMSSTSADV